MSGVTKPHDRFLELLLSDPEEGEVLMRERPPKEIAELPSLEPPELMESARGIHTDKYLV